MEAEYNAVTCVAIYMLLMSFSQKGIDKLRNFQEHMGMRHPEGDFVVSEGFDAGEDSSVSWIIDGRTDPKDCSLCVVQGTLPQVQ